MNILIVTASVGSGHEKAAAAIAQGFRDRLPEAELNIVDFMAGSTSMINAIMKSCYLSMLDMVPNLYEFMYNFTAGKKGGGFVQTAMAAVMARTMKGLIRQYSPDIVICTHPFPADAIAHLSERWRKQFLSAALITDYSVHQMWVCANIQMYFVAHDAMIRDLAAQGGDGNSTFATGIPVDKVFHRNYDRQALRQAVNLNDEDPVLLIMGGGLGLGGMEDAMSQLEKVKTDLQLLVVAGRNQELENRVRQQAEKSHHRVTVFGYTDKVQELMGAADLLISKPGALTLTEAMSMGLPMLLHQPIPGPETDNARFMSDHGMAHWLRTNESLAEAVEDLISTHGVLRHMSEAAKRHRRPDAVGNIVKQILRRYENSSKIS